MIVDSHTHVACGDDPRFPTHPTGVASDWWRAGGSVDTLLAEMAAADVERAVVVQAVGAYGHDCRCAAAAVADHPSRLALVASLDLGPDVDEPGAALLELAASTPIAGVRAFGVGADEPDWLTDGRGLDLWEAAASIGLVVIPTLFSRHLPALRALVEKCPNVVVALDHCAFPDMGDGGRELMRLADLPEVHLKVSSYVLEAADRDEGDPAPWLERLLEAFDAERLCWGSDHPQDQRRPYGDKLTLARHAARNLDAGARDALLGGTALRLWWP